MKKQLLYLIILIPTIKSYCQETSNSEGYMLQTSPYLVYAFRDKGGTPDFSVRNRWNSSYWFKVDNTASGRYQDPVTGEKYIRVTIPSNVRFDDKLGKRVRGDAAKGFDIAVPWKAEQDIDISDFNTWLWISEKDFNLKIPYTPQRVKSTFVLSGLTVPFKYRPPVANQNNSIINGDLNLGSFIGARFSNWFNLDIGVSIGGHFGISSISLNASNNSALTGDKAETIQGFVYGAGIIFDVKKEFQIGVVLGQDFGVGNLAETYIYQGRNWYSFSLNYNFIRSKSKDTNGEQGKKEEKKLDGK